MTPSRMDLRRPAAVLMAAACTVGLVASPAAAAPAFRTALVSVSSGERQADADSSGFALSADGRYVAFASSATNLVPGDTNGADDIFLRDRRTGTTRLITAKADAESWLPSISGDGRYVAFVSSATTLVAGDTNGYSDIFVRDVRTGATRRIDTGREQFNGTITPDGRQVLLSTSAPLTAGDTDEQEDVYLCTLATGAYTRVSVPRAGTASDGGSYYQASSLTSRYIVFGSFASNLVPGDTNDQPDIYRRDLVTGTTTRVSLTDDDQQTTEGSYEPSVSADGRYVAFTSNGGLVPGDPGAAGDVFVRDLTLGTTTVVSATTTGAVSDHGSGGPTVSADGRYIAFGSWAPDLATGDVEDGNFDIFIRDMRAGHTVRASVTPGGGPTDGWTNNATMTPDARHLAFDSYATNLVRRDTNGANDIFVQDR